jgi:hypothetical protein
MLLRMLRTLITEYEGLMFKKGIATKTTHNKLDKYFSGHYPLSYPYLE